MKERLGRGGRYGFGRRREDRCGIRLRMGRWVYFVGKALSGFFRFFCARTSNDNYDMDAFHSSLYSLKLFKVADRGIEGIFDYFCSLRLLGPGTTVPESYAFVQPLRIDSLVVNEKRPCQN